MKKIPIYEPQLIGNEKKYLIDCIDTNWISSQGQYISRFESAIQEYHKVKYSVVTSSCTTALHLAIKALDIGKGDEVICPNLTFIAPANMILLSGAKLVLVDIDENTLTIDVNSIEEKINNKTKAIIAVHQFGHAAHMDELNRLGEKYNLKIIEDNAESIGGKYKGKLLGTLGDISTYSFFGNKIITTGEGGALLTNNSNINEKALILRDHGMNPKIKYDHLDLGYNYRMTNMQAAIGLAQMENIETILLNKSLQMEMYYNELININNLKLRKFSEWCSPVHWLMTIHLENEKTRNSLIDHLNKEGIETRKMINPVSSAHHIKSNYCNSDFPKSVEISKCSMHLPSGPKINEGIIKFVADKIREYFN